MDIEQTLLNTVALIEKSRASCPGDRFPSFIHQISSQTE